MKMVVDDSVKVQEIKIGVNMFNFSDIQAEHGEMERRNHLTDNSVKVQEPHENHNKFKWNKLQAEYGGLEARDALASDQEGDNSTKVN